MKVVSKLVLSFLFDAACSLEYKAGMSGRGGLRKARSGGPMAAVGVANRRRSISTHNRATGETLVTTVLTKERTSFTSLNAACDMDDALRSLSGRSVVVSTGFGG